LRKDDIGERPFRRVLVANRGEIAVRIIRACRELGVETVAVFSDADAHAAHVAMADVAIRLGPAPAAESYLRADAIVDAAKQTGADAIHPGYGFLAERASFAKAVEDAGIAFVGPSSATIAALGDKLAARRSATEAGVAVVPGTLEPAAVDRPDAVAGIVEQANRIGYPLLVKAAAGGGGRGMRRVGSAAELPAALAAGAAEAEAAFGDGSVYLEREIGPARHVEVQLLGDRQGTIVAIGERDCTIQRRHQKLIEEAPAPGLDADERHELHGMAVRVARAVGVENAVTAEFLFDAERRFWFLEVNTRLQVEHGVSELVADLDIVREQLFLAAGQPLSERVRAAAAQAAAPTRHAIEVRISAEDPARDFAPAPGRIGRWDMPAGPGVRVDTAVAAGERIPPDYDPLIAKIMVVDTERPAAIARLARALDETVVTGVQTTLPFHRAVIAEPAFVAGDHSIDWVDRHWAAALLPGRAATLDSARWAAAAAATEPFGSGDGRAAARSSADGPAGSEWARAGRLSSVDRWPS
jgi:acetyl/propionyl-CoA carboxylase alpha subunit